MITLGIDIGSITTKAAIIKDSSLLATELIFTGYNSEKAGLKVFDEILDKTGIKKSSIDKIVTTGYGRKNIEWADKSITEITCHAAGAHYTNPKIRSIIDIGGQDSKTILIDGNGRVVDFAMNDKCAAGTGRFLEVMARAMEVDLESFGTISLSSKQPSTISSICTVFAESEVISLISKGEKRENIISGIHESVALRVTAMANRTGLKPPFMMTGGVAKNIGLLRAVEGKLNTKIEVTEKAQENGAIGAAFLAMNL